MRDEVGRDLRRHAIDEVENAVRQARFLQHLCQNSRRGRGFLGRLQNHCAAGRKRSTDLARGLRDREVPRREGGNRTDRLLQNGLAHGRVAGRHDAAVGAARLFGEPVEDVRGRVDFRASLDERLALFAGQDRSRFSRARAQRGCRAAQDVGALQNAGVGPAREGAMRSRCGLFKLLFLGYADLADHGTRGGVEHVDRAAFRAVEPAAVDEELGIRIGHAGTLEISLRRAACRRSSRRSAGRRSPRATARCTHAARAESAGT